MKAQLFSGARGKIQISRKVGSETVTDTLAFVTDVSISENAGLRPTYVVGAMNPIGIEPLSIDVSASIGRIIPINKQGDSTAALDKVNAIDHGLEAAINQILQQEDITITIYDKKENSIGNDRIVASVKYARYAGRSTSVSTGDVASERFNFVGILDVGMGLTDETKNGSPDVGYGFDG